MTKMLRNGLLAGELSLVALAPIGTAVASAAGSVDPGPPVVRTTGDLLRLHYMTRDQDRLRLHDGTCDGTGTVRGGHVTVAAGVGAQHRSGDLDGTRTPDRPLDGTGFQWHR